MADQSQRDIQLTIKASDLSQQTLQKVKTSVDGVTASIDKQTAAAKAGDASAGELRDTLNQLQKAGEALIKQQGLVDLYSKLEQQLSDTKAQADGLREEFINLNNSGGLEGLTKAQTKQLADLQKSLDLAEKKVASTQASMNVQGERLAAAGINGNDLAGAQAAIAETAAKVGVGIGQVNAVLLTYNTTLKETRAAQQQVNAALNEASQVAGLRQMGADALAAADGFGALGVAEEAGAAKTSTFAKSLLEILDPAAHAVTTLDGLEGRINAISAEIGDASKPITSYGAQINGLAQAQSALLGQGKAIDAFERQDEAVNAAAAALAAAKARVQEYGAAAAAATEPNDELAASLERALTDAKEAGNQFAAQKAKLASMSEGLKQAGIDSTNLGKTQERLATVARTAAEASRKIGSIQSGATGSLFGLKPYELQNLSYQINDVFTQIASGTPIMQVVAQQGGQFAQIFPQALSALVRFLPEIAAAAAAFATLYAAIKRVTDLDASVRHFSATLAISADGARYNAQQLALMARSLTDLGVKQADATKAIGAFTDAALDPTKLQAYTKAAYDLSQATGEDVPTAAGKLVTAFRGGYKAVADLDNQFNFLTPAERAQIKAMFDSGNAADARTLAFRRFSDVMDDAAKKSKGPWHDAIVSLTTIWNNFLNAIGNSSVIQGTIQELNSLAALTTKFGGPGAQAGSTGAASGNIRGVPGASLAGAGLGQIALGGLLSGLPGAIQAANTPKQLVVTPEIKDIIQTAVAEARANDTQGIEDVVSVILNRMAQSGLSGSQVVKTSGQFQVQSNGRAAAVDVTSEAFIKALKAVTPLLLGQAPSTVGNAVNFFSPEGQRENVRKGLSNTLRPGFAQDLSRRTAARGGQEFFTGSFPGQKTGADGSDASAKSLKIAQDLLATQQEQIAAQQELNKAEAVRLAGLQATRDFEESGANDGSPQAQAQEAQYVANAQAEAARKADAEILAARRALSSQIAGLEQADAAGQTASLDQVLSAITQKYQSALDAIAIARKKGATSLDDGQTLDDAEKHLKLLEDQAKQQATLKFYEDQLAALEKQRSDLVAGITAQLETGQISAGEAVAKIADVQQKLLPQITAVAAKGKEFAAAMQGATFNPTTAAAIANFANAGAQNTAQNQKAQLKIYEDQVNALVQSQTLQLKTVNDLSAQGSESTAQAFADAKGIVDQTAPAIAQAAKDALALAEAINGVQPSSELAAFISKMRGLVTQQGNPASTAGPLKPVADAQRQEQEQKLNDILSARSEIVDSINTQETQGDITHEQAQQKIAATYAQFAPLIQAQASAYNDLIVALHDAKAISDETFAALEAKLQAVQSQTKFVSQNFTDLKNTITQSFTQGVVTAFDTVTESIGQAIVGTGTWADALRSVGSAALNFAGTFLKNIADMLLQMEALKFIQSAPGLNSLTSGLLGATGLAAPAAALTTAGTTVVAGGTAVGAGAAALSAAAASLLVSAAALQAANVAGSLGQAAGSLGGLPLDLIGLVHGGGTIGDVRSMSRRMPMNPAAWASAPRYHTGYAGVGLKPDEQRAILKKGEEVLSGDNPRNMRNAAKGRGKGGGAQPFSQRIVAVFDEKDIHAALASSAGEQITLAHIKKNAPTVRSMVGGSSR